MAVFTSDFIVTIPQTMKLSAAVWGTKFLIAKFRHNFRIPYAPYSFRVKIRIKIRVRVRVRD